MSASANPELKSKPSLALTVLLLFVFGCVGLAVGAGCGLLQYANTTPVFQSTAKIRITPANMPLTGWPSEKEGAAIQNQPPTDHVSMIVNEQAVEECFESDRLKVFGDTAQAGGAVKAKRVKEALSNLQVSVASDDPQVIEFNYRCRQPHDPQSFLGVLISRYTLSLDDHYSLKHTASIKLRRFKELEGKYKPHLERQKRLESELGEGGTSEMTVQKQRDQITEIQNRLAAHKAVLIRLNKAINDKDLGDQEELIGQLNQSGDLKIDLSDKNLPAPDIVLTQFRDNLYQQISDAQEELKTLVQTYKKNFHQAKRRKHIMNTLKEERDSAANIKKELDQIVSDLDGLPAEAREPGFQLEPVNLTPSEKISPNLTKLLCIWGLGGGLFGSLIGVLTVFMIRRRGKT